MLSNSFIRPSLVKFIWSKGSSLCFPEVKSQNSKENHKHVFPCKCPLSTHTLTPGTNAFFSSQESHHNCHIWSNYCISFACISKATQNTVSSSHPHILFSLFYLILLIHIAGTLQWIVYFSVLTASSLLYKCILAFCYKYSCFILMRILLSYSLTFTKSKQIHTNQICSYADVIKTLKRTCKIKKTSFYC